MTVQNLIEHKKMTVDDGLLKFTLPAWSGAWLG
jgi:hypothetical protein